MVAVGEEKNWYISGKGLVKDLGDYGHGKNGREIGFEEFLFVVW